MGKEYVARVALFEITGRENAGNAVEITSLSTVPDAVGQRIFSGSTTIDLRQQNWIPLKEGFSLKDATVNGEPA